MDVRVDFLECFVFGCSVLPFLVFDIFDGFRRNFEPGYGFTFSLSPLGVFLFGAAPLVSLSFLF